MICEMQVFFGLVLSMSCFVVLCSVCVCLYEEKEDEINGNEDAGARDIINHSMSDAFMPYVEAKEKESESICMNVYENQQCE